MIASVYMSFILVSCIVLVLLFTAQLFFVLNPAAIKISHGSQRDNGLYPKRSKNVNAWYTPPPGGNTDVINAYPIEDPSSGDVFRLRIAPTTKCPIFRQQDNGSTDPPLIG